MTEQMLKKADTIIRLLIANPQGLGPTEMGLHMGYKYSSASSQMQGVLKKMLAQELVERIYPTGTTRYVLDLRVFGHGADYGKGYKNVISVPGKTEQGKRTKYFKVEFDEED